MRGRLALLSCLCLGALAGVAMGSAAPVAGAATVLRGIDDGALPGLAAGARDQHLDQIKNGLRASVLRVDCQWPLAEPARGQYSDADGSGYLALLEQTVADAHTLGLKVIVTMDFVPKWASDPAYWSDPPAPSYGTGYQEFYPMTQAALADYQAFARHLSTALAGEVLGYEAYNEPNLWVHLYPQRTDTDPRFAADEYLKYLEAFGAGVKAGDPGALVIAGSTAPSGSDDDFRTSPQTFAARLKAKGAGAYFDVYAHHPYVPGGAPDMDPGLPPQFPTHTVSLSNIGTLLKIFPTKPFYLTEYGFSTEPSLAFGPPVTEAQQAAYLTKAYALAGRHSQVKMLVWYLLQDTSPTGKPTSPLGWYLGLRRVSGTAKPAWYAFARGNHITLAAPARARRGSRILLRGRFTCASIGGVSGVRLLVERRVGAGRWRVLRSVTTRAGGAYAVRVTLGVTQRLRVVFLGVVRSRQRLVTAR